MFLTWSTIVQLSNLNSNLLHKCFTTLPTFVAATDFVLMYLHSKLTLLCRLAKAAAPKLLQAVAPKQC